VNDPDEAVGAEMVCWYVKAKTQMVDPEVRPTEPPDVPSLVGMSDGTVGSPCPEKYRLLVTGTSGDY
jgi:hypothetical protein